MLQANQRIADFAVQRFVGRGPMSEVYLVRHVIRTTQVAAVKIFTDPRCMRRLLADADAMARSSLLQHSNIVAVIQAAPMAQPPFVVSDYCPGGNLRTLINARPMDAADAVAILRQILAALKYAHAMGLAHGNLKPENVLLDDRAVGSRFTDDGSVKVSEFGLGRAQIGAILEAGNTIDPSVLNEIAPEVRQGQIPDATADLFSCGMILFELLTGRVPRPGDLPIHFDKQSPPALNLVYRKATAPRDQRFKSADEFLAALSQGPQPDAPTAGESPVWQFDATTISPSSRPPPDIPPVAIPASGPKTPASAEPVELALAPMQDDEPIAAEPSLPLADDIAPPPQAQPAAPPSDEENPLAVFRTKRAAAFAPPPRPARTTIVDELQHRPLRTTDALRGAFNAFVESTPLASSEVANIRIRIGQWSANQGGDDNLASNIEIVRAVTTPIYRIILRTSASRPDSGQLAPVDVASLLPSADSSIDCAAHLGAEDFRAIIHLSTDAFWPDSLGPLELPRLTGPIGELLNDSDQDLNGAAIVRQELIISRAMVIDVQLVYGGAKFNVALAGNALKVVAPIKPFRRGNPQVLRRVAMALDTPRMPEALGDLRQCLDPDGTPERAEFLLGSLRRRLAQAYLREARETATVSWLEGLDLVSRAEALSSTESAIPPFRQSARKREAMLYLFCALIIGAIFGLLGGTTRPISVPFIAAGGAALLSGVISWAVLRMRFRRTLAAFCHALLLPTAIACIIATAPPKFHGAQGDIIRGVILALVVCADIVLFKKFGKHFLTSHHAEPLGGDPDAVVGHIQAFLSHDWPWLERHYMELGPMANFVRANDAMAESPGGS